MQMLAFFKTCCIEDIKKQNKTKQNLALKNIWGCAAYVQARGCINRQLKMKLCVCDNITIWTDG